MSAEAVDVLVVGGGIHGVGVAQAAAAAGLDTLLLERTALAAGTSSRSSKLVHGGLRYLESGQLGLVRESLAERRRLLACAPGLVRLVDFHLPVYRDTRRRPWWIRAGLTLYAALAGFEPAARFSRLPRRDWDGLDGLRTEGLRAVFRFGDAQTDDALLTRAVMDSAQGLGATLRCPATLLEAAVDRSGVSARFEDAGRVRTVRAATLVNAAGPWVDRVLDLVRPAPPRVAVELVQGAHIEVAGTVTRGVYYVEAPQDGRAVFVMPWHGRTLVGTTETPFQGDPGACRPLEAEQAYLAEVLAHHFPGRRAGLPDTILDAWAGLRVLPAGEGRAFHRSRETMLASDDPRRPRVLTIYGGKLTTYRATAARVLAALAPSLPRRERRADTADLPLAAPAGTTGRPALAPS